MIRKEIWSGRQLLLFLTCKRLFGKWNIWIWPPISTVKIRFQDSRKLWSASTFLDFIEDSILKSQYKNYIKLISSLGSSEDRCSQGHHETFKLLWEAIWGIQVVNHIITVAATKSTTESVYNSNSWKNYREQAMRDSFEVQKDGRTGLCSPDVTAWSRLSLTNILVTKNG